MLALKHEESSAGRIEAEQTSLGGKVLPVRPELCNDCGTARTVRGFAAAELVCWRVFPIQINCTSVVVVRAC